MGWLDKVRSKVAGAETDPVRVLYVRGNALRDERAWAEAAAVYASYLAHRPDDRGITVQYGHMLKESGEPARALGVYRQAEAMQPNDPDIHLQIGHALKLLGQADEAALSYRRAAELDPTATAPWRELAALQQQGVAPSGATHASAAVLLDISDLFEWARTRRQPSGIQRVQLGIAAAVLNEGLDAALVATRPGSSGFRPVPDFWFRRLHGLMRAPGDAEGPDFQAMRAAIDALLDSPALVFSKGQILLTLGSAWALPGYFQPIAAARSTVGLRHVAVVHDMGPILYPEDAPPGLAQAFTGWFAGLAQHADGVIVASQVTGDDVARLASLPTAVVPFDARPDWPAPSPDHPVLTDPRPFVAWVGSLEARKDHPFVFAAWKRLAAELGEATPRLVCAGRLAEGAEATLAALRDDPVLARHVMVLTDADDALVAALLGRARFALYHSRHEGWGLPVTEALSLGTPIVIPDLPGLRDAARGLAITVPPGDEAALVACLGGLMRDPGLLADARARIAAAPPWRDWGDVARDLLTEATRLSTTARSTLRKAPTLPFGQRLALGLPGPRTSAAEQMMAVQARHGGGWHAAEDWGCWTEPGLALLRLGVAETATPREMTLRLELRVPPGEGGAVEARVDRSDADGAWSRLRLPGGGLCSATLCVPPGAGPMLLRLQSETATAIDNERQVGVGVVAVTLLSGEEAEARIALLEADLFTQMTLASTDTTESLALSNEA